MRVMTDKMQEMHAQRQIDIKMLKKQDIDKLRK